jgi:heat shock protein 5
MPLIRLAEKLFSPEEIAAATFAKLRQSAETFLGQEVKYAVVTCPAYFNEAQRLAIKHAGALAGLNVLRVINEPTAAAIAYDLAEDTSGDEKNIIVFDLGGGTFDVSLLTMDDGIFEVVANNGDTHLGGRDFDQRIMDHLFELFKSKTGKDASQDKRAVAKLRQECERAKRVLSSHAETTVEIENFFDGEDLIQTLTRARFEELNSDLFDRTIEILQAVLTDAKLKKHEIDDILLVGGSTHIPKVRQLVKDFFDGKEPKLGIDPDETLTFGAAVQGGILAGAGRSDPCITLDVVPLSLGVGTLGGVMTVVVHRNALFPLSRTRTFLTDSAGNGNGNATHVRVAVFEGERKLTQFNRLLGWVDFERQPRLEITFEILLDRTLEVAGKRMTAWSGHNRDEAELTAMLEEAEQALSADLAAVASFSDSCEDEPTIDEDRT